jgi:hypothetical protein
MTPEAILLYSEAIAIAKVKKIERGGEGRGQETFFAFVLAISSYSFKHLLFLQLHVTVDFSSGDRVSGPASNLVYVHTP